MSISSQNQSNNCLLEERKKEKKKKKKREAGRGGLVLAEPVRSMIWGPTKRINQPERSLKKNFKLKKKVLVLNYLCQHGRDEQRNILKTYDRKKATMDDVFTSRQILNKQQMNSGQHTRATVLQNHDH